MTESGETGDVPDDAGARRETPMATRIKERLRRTGPLSMNAYVNLCLSDPEHGYYATRDVIGQTGDFTTAPEISQIFGELIGLWCAVVWQQMGQPASLTLIELGPGRGTLMKDVLRATANVPGFHDALQIVLVEHAENLRAAQAQALSNAQCALDRVGDYRRLFESASVAPERATLLIANEFFDALPAETRICDGRCSSDDPQNIWLTYGVSLDGDRLIERTIERAQDIGSPRNKPIDHETGRLNARFPDAKPGDLYIDQSGIFRDFADLVAQFDRVAALVIDYGHTEPTVGDTLQAVRDHRFENPLTSPGEADLSYQVAFGEFTEALREKGLAVDGPITQTEFLGALGLAERASRLMAANPARAHEIEAGALRLVAPNAMGTRFKVLGARSKSLPPLPGLPPKRGSTP